MISREDWLAAQVGARIDGCPEAEELQRFAEEALDAEQRQRVGQHLDGCSACSEALAWLRADGAPEELDPDAELPREVEARTERVIDETTGRGPLRAKSPSRVWAGLAAAIVITLISFGVWQLRDPSAAPEPVYREADNGAVRSLVSHDHALPRSDFLLRWSVEGDVSHYDLWVSTDALEPIAEVKGLTDPEHLLDASLLEELDTGAKLIWQVEAVRPGGVRIRSGTFVVRLE